LEFGYILVARQQGTLGLSETLEAGFGSPASVGALLFDKYLIPFEVTSILLLVAMVGAIVITRNERKEGA
jgi:NADH:ubiquinone oxidoreductase subunit 6 (subunit J)